MCEGTLKHLKLRNNENEIIHVKGMWDLPAICRGLKIYSLLYNIKFSLRSLLSYYNQVINNNTDSSLPYVLVRWYVVCLALQPLCLKALGSSYPLDYLRQQYGVDLPAFS